MLEDQKTQELRRKVQASEYDYNILDNDELKYLLSKSINAHEQGTIEKLYILRQHEELVKETRKLARCTWGLTIATWFLALMTVLGYLIK
jgi:hypothetical protein